MRAAVVGHVEWVQFARVTRVPGAGEIVHARESWEEAAGGGAVAAVQLARLAGGALFLTALGDDELGRRARDELVAHGVGVDIAWRTVAQRRAFTFLDDAIERTITVMGERIVPLGRDQLCWSELGDVEAVYFTGGDAEALRAARAARVLVATPRAREAIAASGVTLDVLVRSGTDPGEVYEPGEFDPAPRAVITTLGERGGRWESVEGGSGEFRAAALPGPKVDAYGAGDCFAAGLTHGLASGMDLAGALELASRCGAACLAGRGPYGNQLGDEVR